MATMAMEKNTHRGSGKTFRRDNGNRAQRINLRSAKERALEMAECEENAFEDFAANRTKRDMLEDWD